MKYKTHNCYVRYIYTHKILKNQVPYWNAYSLTSGKINANKFNDNNIKVPIHSYDLHVFIQNQNK